MKQRLLLCLLLALALIYMALPKLSIGTEGLGGIFSLMWLGFAVIVIGGNLTGLLYSKKLKTSTQVAYNRRKNPSKLRRYSS